jgi:hypothetical protein
MRSRSGGMCPLAGFGLAPWCPHHFPDYTRSPLRCDMNDPLGHIIVGSLDPTSDLDKNNGYRECGFEWFDDTCLALVLRWQCTREWGHPGQHLAGTGNWVAAVHTATSGQRAHRSSEMDSIGRYSMAVTHHPSWLHHPE